MRDRIKMNMNNIRDLELLAEIKSKKWSGLF